MATNKFLSNINKKQTRNHITANLSTRLKKELFRTKTVI